MPTLSSIGACSASEAESNILNAYDLNANYYITKPADLDQFLKAVRTSGSPS